MTDFLSTEDRSRRMAAVKTHGTEPERRVRQLLRSLGCSYRTNVRNLPGRPDLVVTKLKLAILVHGCFWHAHTCRQGRIRPRTRTEFWDAKRTANRARDRRNLKELRALGWRVLVVWQCQLRDEKRLLSRLRSHLLPPGEPGPRITF